MEKDARYEFVKDLNDEEVTFKKGQILYRTHGVYYVDGMLMPMYYQDQFRRLINYEQENGWNYLEEIQ